MSREQGYGERLGSGRLWLVCRAQALLVCAALLSTGVSISCSKGALPEEFGWFVVEHGALRQLEPNQGTGEVHVWGGTITGLFKPGDTYVADGNISFVLFDPGLPQMIGELKLSRLEFERSRWLEQGSGGQRVVVNMYTPKADVRFRVLPFKRELRMFRVVPDSTLSAGLYAFHFGGLGAARSSGDLGSVFDFVIGKDSLYVSASGVLAKEAVERRVRGADEMRELESTIQALVKRYNDAFNEQDDEELAELYWPGGRPMSSGEREKYEDGVESWYRNAGRIVECEITRFSQEGGQVAVDLQVRYGKRGVESEKVICRQCDGMWRITRAS